MKSIRESNLFRANQRLTERKSIVGAFSPFDKDIFRDKFWYPHEEMTECVNMYNRNSFAQSAINTMKEFIKGGEVIVKSDCKKSMNLAQGYFDILEVDDWIDEVIENALKTGNAYAEIDYLDTEWKEPYKIYPLADSSRIYLNVDEHGRPHKIDVFKTDPITKQPVKVERRNEKEFYIQRIDAGFRHPKAKWYDMSYHSGFVFKQFRIYGIPINKRKIIHFRINLGDNGVYGRSYLASSLDDYESLKQIERSIAIIAKYKAVPRDIIMYGDKENPATNDELDEFIIYLESLEKDESAIVNKPIKRESLAYAGQDINLEYMIKHISKKIIAGIAPDFMMGLGDQITKANAQIVLISYILAIYSKRKMFLKPLEKYLLKPFVKKHGLKDCWLEFGELDFETKNETANRVGALWTQNLLTFNEARIKLGLTAIGDIGNVYYLEWQTSMMNGNDFGFPSIPGSPDGNLLPNNEPVDKVFDHNSPPKKNPVAKGGDMPLDKTKSPSNIPKFLPKKDLGKPGSQAPGTQQYEANRSNLTKEAIGQLYNIGIPEDFNLESNKDYGSALNRMSHKHEKTGGRDLPDENFDEDELTAGIKIEMEHTDDEAEAKKIAKDHLVEIPDYYTRLVKMEDEEKLSTEKIKSLKEAVMKIELPDVDVMNPSIKKISFETLMHEFAVMFKEPRMTELWYKKLDNGWRVSFVKNTLMVYCDVAHADIISYYSARGEEVSEEDAIGLITQWFAQHLDRAIKEE